MKITIGVLLALAMAYGQNPSVPPKFEVASVKRAEQCGGAGSMGPGSVILPGVFLKAVLMEAFQVKMERIEGPGWLESDCFAISAKMPEGATRDQVPAMLQTLLAERFKLAAHKDDRTRSGNALVVDQGGPKFQEDDAGANFMGKNKGMMFYSAARASFGALKGVMTMATLASNLSTKGYGPVEDQTGLTGKYDIDLRWTSSPDRLPPGPDPVPPPPPGWPDRDLPTALRESLGLKLERRNVQVQYLVVDHIERVPSEN